MRFHDGRILTSRDVKWTFDSLLQGKIRSTKAAVYQYVDHIDAPDDATVDLPHEGAGCHLLWNLSDGAIGIVPYGSGEKSAAPHRLRAIQFRKRRNGSRSNC